MSKPIYIDEETGLVLTGTLHDDGFDGSPELRSAILKWRGLRAELTSDEGRRLMAKAYNDHELRTVEFAACKLEEATAYLVTALRCYEKFWLQVEDANDDRNARERKQRLDGLPRSLRQPADE